MYACMILISWIGAKAIVASGNNAALGMTTGDLTALFSYATQILTSLMMLSMIFAMLTISLASGRRIAEILEEKTDILNPDTPQTVVQDGSIRFENVDFIYASKADKRVLDNINLSIASGETVGIIGGTGSSKSSLVQLIPRLYDVTNGRITIGGIDVRDYDLNTLRNAVAMVLQKDELFSKVRSGKVRVLLGSTLKMGAGTNVQDKLIALHHLDIPWRPADIEQQEGRIIRRGNENDTVFIYRYVTENTFDAYSWQLLEQKQRFISQIMHGGMMERSCDDIDNTALSFAELKALSAGDPRIKEKMDLDVEVSRLKLLKNNYDNERYILEDNVLKHYPKKIEGLCNTKLNLEQDMKTVQQNVFSDNDSFFIKIDGVVYTDKKEGGETLLKKISSHLTIEPTEIGVYRGFTMKAYFDNFSKEFSVYLCGKAEHKTIIGNDSLGNITRLDNTLDRISKKAEEVQKEIDNLHTQIEMGKEELKKPFPHEQKLRGKMERLVELNNVLNLEKKESEVIAEPKETIPATTQPDKVLCTMER